MTRDYKAAMIIVGNEILSGRTKDKNVNYVANALSQKGIPLKEVRIIPDEHRTVVETVKVLSEQFDYVFTSGGIGPTHDDITTECVAEALGSSLEVNAEAYALLLDYYGEADFTEARQKMAQIPVGGSLISNAVSVAPGFVLGNVYVMAGVPRILQTMVDHVIPQLKGGAHIYSKSLECGIRESVLAPGLADIQVEYEDVEIGCYPRFQQAGGVQVTVVLRSTNEALLELATSDVESLMNSLPT